jgi:hypothetical protein
MSDELDEKAYAGLQELLKDAESCTRLSQWEEEFLSDMRGRVLVHKERTHISDAQWRVLQRIEEKVYA